MTLERRPESEAKILSEPVATRLLDRASQLDAALKSGAMVADLRAAAVEAGISSKAFDAALAELDVQTKIADTRDERRPRTYRAIGLGLVGAVVAMVLAVAMFVLPTVSAAPLSVQSFALRCVTPDQAAALLKPVTTEPNTAVQYSSTAPGVLTVRGTKEQILNVKALLDKYEAPGTGACPIDVPRK